MPVAPGPPAASVKVNNSDPLIMLDVPQEISAEPVSVKVTVVIVKVMLLSIVNVPPTVTPFVCKVVLPLMVTLLRFFPPPSIVFVVPDITTVEVPGVIVVEVPIAKLPAKVCVALAKVIVPEPVVVKLLRVLLFVVSGPVPFSGRVPGVLLRGVCL